MARRAAPSDGRAARNGANAAKVTQLRVARRGVVSILFRRWMKVAWCFGSGAIAMKNKYECFPFNYSTKPDYW